MGRGRRTNQTCVERKACMHKTGAIEEGRTVGHGTGAKRRSRGGGEIGRSVEGRWGWKEGMEERGGRQEKAWRK